MKKDVFLQMLQMALLFMVAIFCIISATGCMVAEGEKTTYLSTGEIQSCIKVKMTQCMVDSARNNFTVDVEDLGKVTLGSSVMDAEEFKAILVELKPYLMALLGI